ncbi:hypothetical protein ACSBL2_13845 [Pedobacter sp. AW31-3R]|uniref:hypothetical protein n=1 Tax=Pedobacter sp. AW31-3R TaxID=3445781 RepID=UPI003FA0FEB0
MRRDLKLSSIIIVAALLVIVYFVAKYIVFPVLHIALGLVAGIFTAVLTVLILLLLYFYLKQAFRRK